MRSKASNIPYCAENVSYAKKGCALVFARIPSLVLRSKTLEKKLVKIEDKGHKKHTSFFLSEAFLCLLFYAEGITNFKIRVGFCILFVPFIFWVFFF